MSAISNARTNGLINYDEAAALIDLYWWSNSTLRMIETRSKMEVEIAKKFAVLKCNLQACARTI